MTKRFPGDDSFDWTRQDDRQSTALNHRTNYYRFNGLEWYSTTGKIPGKTPTKFLMETPSVGMSRVSFSIVGFTSFQFGRDYYSK